ncbi:succinylglutamate-semialdehyde dehydrogenase [Hirschia litorea]|uniref:Succinylglutamate-semialdehyde dehydrogenase n=1 Tax=Hirschia litorea TaxID=1199156 RepID=A0ABW2IIE8_9PROT
MTQDTFINGIWSVGKGSKFDSISPSDGTVVGSYHAADAKQVEDAIASARKAFDKWSLTAQTEREAVLVKYAAALEERKQAIADAISLDMGKPKWEAITEAGAMVAKIAGSITAQSDRAGSWTKETDFGAISLTHRPFGVMAVFGPFNFPGHLPNGHIVPALLAGNTIVFKPSELAPSVANLMVEAFEEAGLPHGCVNVVHGGRDTGQALLNGDINGLLFTGSHHTGTAFHRHFAGRPDVMLALEMGGNNPLIVHKTDDVAGAAEVIFQSAFITTGQRCTCARRLILPTGQQGDDILAAVIEKIDAVKIGPWDGEDVYLGPLVSAKAVAQALAFQNERVALGGKLITPLRDMVENTGIVRPGIIDMTDADTPPDEELFGPFLQVYRESNLDKAIAIANDTRFGLSAGVVTSDDDVWEYTQARLRVGILNRNRPTTGASGAMPFGGPGLSGNARPSAYYAADYCAWPQARQIG